MAEVKPADFHLHPCNFPSHPGSRIPDTDPTEFILELWNSGTLAMNLFNGEALSRREKPLSVSLSSR